VLDSLDELSKGDESLQVADSQKQQTHYPQSGDRHLAYDALVLDAILKQSLATVRSLGSRGLRVAALGTSDSLATYSSKWCKQAFVCTSEEGTNEYLAFLEKVLDENNTRVLITSSDATIELIRRHRKRLEQRVGIALAKESALSIALNKERTLQFAKNLGISTPRAVIVQSDSEVEAALHEIGLPVVVKPMQSWVWSNQQGMRLASKLVTTSDEARTIVEELTNLGVKAILQQYLSGRRE
jgi:predicted ATP-grasp superfamily ATP-dependent carboligase